MKNSMKKIAAVILSAVIVISAAAYIYRSSDRVFSFEKWAAHPEKRYMMVDSLIKKNKLEGMTKAEIYSLLGDKNLIRPNKSVLNYSLGDAQSTKMLSIRFGEDGKVAGFEISGE